MFGSPQNRSARDVQFFKLSEYSENKLNCRWGVHNWENCQKICEYSFPWNFPAPKVILNSKKYKL